MRFLCRIGWHDYGQWKVISRSGVLVLTVVQECQCYHCGYTKVKSVKIY